MITIETSISEISGTATFYIYDDAVLVISYDYSNITQLISISPLLVDLHSTIQEYIKNVNILSGWVQSLEASFGLEANNQLVTSRNYDYEYDGNNGFRRCKATIGSDEFRVRYNFNSEMIIIRARNAFEFNFSEITYFKNCHLLFASTNDLFTN